MTFQLSSVLNDSMDLKKLNWAWHVVNTRCVFLENPEHELVESGQGGDSLAIIPVMDMLNHEPKAQVKYGFQC